MDLLSFKHVKGVTEECLERRQLSWDDKEFLEEVLEKKEHIEGEDYKRWRRLMRC